MASQLTVEQAQGAGIDLVTGGKGRHAVHDTVTAMRANRRTGSANTKTRAEVAGSNSKPWRQKGTGRARAGSRVSPIWRGGGVVFGPRPRSYAKKINRTTKRLALRAALGDRIESGDVIVVPEFSIGDGKTRTFVQQLHALNTGPKALIVSEAFDDKTYLAARNVGSTLLTTAREVNVEQLLRYDKIVLTENSLPVLAARTQSA